MCGACVSVRKCCSARLGSGTVRKRDSTPSSTEASRKPKMEASALPPSGAGNAGDPGPAKSKKRRAQARTLPDKLFMRLLQFGFVCGATGVPACRREARLLVLIKPTQGNPPKPRIAFLAPFQGNLRAG